MMTFVFSVGTTLVTNRVYLRFDRVALGTARIPPDGSGALDSFRSRDGVDLIVGHFDFPSHEAARVAFQDMVAGAERIVEREVIYDREAKRTTGERVVIKDHIGRGLDAAIIILDDTRLYEFCSTSLRHALSFERSHRRY